MRSLLTLVAFSVSVVAAPTPKVGKKEDKFEGVWKLESKVNRGRFIDYSKDDRYMSIDAKGRVVSHYDPEPEDEESSGRFEIDREKKWFDYVDDNWPTSNLPSIYEMDGDTLKFCSSVKDANVRPDKVASGPGVVLETWKRVKPKEKK